MARGDAAVTALLARIAGSGVSLTIHFPNVRTTDAITGPATRPASPLTGPAPVETLALPADTPLRAPVTLPCLWLDSPLSESPSSAPWHELPTGWVDGADALARVAASDVLVDVDDPSKGTLFEQAAYVETRNLRFRVLKANPMGPSFRPPHTVSVWLVGALKQ